MNTTIADRGSATVTDQPEARQLRRSGDDKMLAGVAGGMARYLNADVTLVRVIIAALVLLGVIHPTGSVDRTALRWHVGVWDLWFLVWGILLALATVGYWRRTATRARRDGTANRAHS